MCIGLEELVELEIKEIHLLYLLEKINFYLDLYSNFYAKVINFQEIAKQNETNKCVLSCTPSVFLLFLSGKHPIVENHRLFASSLSNPYSQFTYLSTITFYPQKNVY